MTNKLLGGRYQIERQVGGGGMAVVYRAVDSLLGRTVAVKMLRAQYAGDEEFVSRFRQEAQSAARLSHANIVNLYDVGTVDGEYYIVMEYIDGPTLKDVIRDRGPLSVSETLDITKQICDALGHAHEHHIIHRDIKPHNILLTKSGVVKVTDFGLARAMTGNTLTHQPGSSVLGSVHYFSPEQARGGTTDIKTDIYSLGVVMYEMLTKQLPFSGDTPVSVALKHLRDQFIEPRQLIPSIPQSVENIVLRCMAKSPNVRYPDMGAVKKDLRDALIYPDVPKFMAPQGVSDETIVVPIIGNLTSMTDEVSPSRTQGEPVKRRTWWRGILWSLMVIVLLVVGAFAAYYIVMKVIQVPNISLPNVVGDAEAQALSKLQAASFPSSQIQEQKAANQKPKGTVYAQDPVGPTEVKQNRTITLYISTGPPQVTMPTLQGVPVEQAIQTLQDAGFANKNIIEQQVQSSQDSGIVVDTKPAAGTSLTVDTQVILVVSKGTMTTVPKIVGLSLDEAKQALVTANLQVGQISFVPYQAQDNTVFQILPYTVGEKIPAGTKIDLYVAQNPPPSANGSANTPGNTTASTTGTDSLPPNASMKTVPVTVNNTSTQPLTVKIVKTDATGNQQTVINTTISQTTTWTVPFYLTPGSSGELWVVVNGQLVQHELVG